MGNLQANATISFNVRATIGAQSGQTGREISCDEDYGEAATWAMLPTEIEILQHPSCIRFLSILLTTKAITEDTVTGFRGRPESQTGPNPDSTSMGPPESHQTGDQGRYNKKGVRALYLSDSEIGVLRELLDEPIFIQRFNIPELRIADLRLLAMDSFMNGVMWPSEYAGTEGYPSKIFSQVIGGLVGKHFDGMIVPGVRGHSNEHYSNIVVLRNLDNWRKWLCENEPPYKHPSPS